MKYKFDEALNEKLKFFFKDDLFTSIRKSKICIKNSNGSGELNIVYSTKGDGYYFVLTGDCNELKSLLLSNPPPYPPKTLAKQMFCFSTLEEKYPTPPVSAQSKLIHPPNREIDVDALCDLTVDLINEKYISLINNFINHSTTLIEDIKRNPTAYAYPFFSILICLKSSGKIYNDSEMKEYARTKCFGDKDFDIELAKKYLV